MQTTIKSRQTSTVFLTDFSAHRALPNGTTYNDDLKKFIYAAPEVWCISTNSTNRPFPSSKKSHFQNEAKCETFVVKMSFICIIIENHFHINGFALNLVLKVRCFWNSEMAYSFWRQATLFKFTQMKSVLISFGFIHSCPLLAFLCCSWVPLQCQASYFSLHWPLSPFKVTRTSYFVAVPSYFDALWYPHLYFK